MMNLRFISSCTIDDVIYFTIINRGKSLQQLVPGLWHIGFGCVLPTNSLGWWLRAIRGRSGRVEGILQLPTPKSLTPGLRPKTPDTDQDRGCSARQRRYCQYCRNGAWAVPSGHWTQFRKAKITDTDTNLAQGNNTLLIVLCNTWCWAEVKMLRPAQNTNISSNLYNFLTHHEV